MLPNLHLPTYDLFGLVPIEPFGVLVAAAIVVGYFLAKRRARVTGLDPEILADSALWIVLVGFVVAHVVSMVFYYPRDLLKDPIRILYFWSGISSFGGFIGGAVAAVVYFRRLGLPVMRYCEALLFGFVPAWVLGRMGCTIAFDHRGAPTEFVLGMADRLGVVRHNLGFYEMLFALVLTVIIYGLRNVRPVPGFHIALVLLLYSPVRFAMDFLREEDKTYWGLTPGQYIAVAALLVGVGLIVRGLFQSSGHPPQSPQMDPDGG